MEAIRRLCSSAKCDLQVSMIAELLRFLQEVSSETPLQEILEEFVDWYINSFFLTPEDLVRELGLDEWTGAVVIAAEKHQALQQVKREAVRVLLLSLLPAPKELEEVLNQNQLGR